MNLICPKCSTIYKIDHQKLLPSGKTVKCTKCHHLWFEKYSVTAKKEDSYRYPLPVIIRKFKKKKYEFSLKPTTLFIGGLILIFSLIVLQDYVVDILPSSAKIYDKLGMPSTNNIVLDRFEILRNNDNDIEINGLIVNKASDIRRIPRVKITLLDKQGNTLKTIIPQIQVSYFLSNEHLPFSYHIANIPPETYLVSIKVAGKLDLLSNVSSS